MAKRVASLVRFGDGRRVTKRLELEIPLPGDWPRWVKQGLLQASALYRSALLLVLAGFESGPVAEARLCAELEQLRLGLAASREENRILRARLGRIAPGRRPHYPARERLAILVLRAAQGWTAAETARRFLVGAETIASWMRRIDEQGEGALVQSALPVNRYPEMVVALVQRLGSALPHMGAKRIANTLARSGLHLAASTVRRMLRREPVEPPAPPAPPQDAGDRAKTSGGEREDGSKARSRTGTVRADYPHHLWHIDITTMPTAGGFWAPWVPQCIAALWPWGWHIVMVLDHFSRSPVVSGVFRKQPSAADVCGVLERGVGKAGRPPRHIVSDRGAQFQDDYRKWCDQRGVRPRFGAIGKHGSIAVIERFFRTLKSEYLRCIGVPLSQLAMQRELDVYLEWYTLHRPHEALGGATPGEMLEGALPAAGQLPLEPRRRHPLARGDPERFGRRVVQGRLELVISSHEGRAVLPVVEIREAA